MANRVDWILVRFARGCVAIPAPPHRHLAAGLAALLLFAAGAAVATGQSRPSDPATQNASLVFDGNVKNPQRLSEERLRSLPAERAEVSFQTSRGTETSSYAGVLLWTLLAEAGGIDDSAKGAELRHTIMITGRDGYRVVISTGEIAPDFGGKRAMLAYERDGKDLGQAGLRVVMPGDKRGGRSVRDVVRIEIE